MGWLSEAKFCSPHILKEKFIKWDLQNMVGLELPIFLLLLTRQVRANRSCTLTHLEVYSLSTFALSSTNRTTRTWNKLGVPAWQRGGGRACGEVASRGHLSSLPRGSHCREVVRWAGKWIG